MPNYAPYAESTKQRIVDYVRRNPGRTGRDIGIALGLDRSRVNSFLYSEGKRRFGLRVINWRWSAEVVQGRTTIVDSWPTVRSARAIGERHGIQSDSLPVQSICGALKQVGISNATLKIRGMSEQQVNLAFAEDDYQYLDERLQVELAIRRSELLAQKTSTSTKPSPLQNPLVIIGIFLIGFLWLSSTINNANSDKYQRSIPSSTR